MKVIISLLTNKVVFLLSPNSTVKKLVVCNLHAVDTKREPIQSRFLVGTIQCKQCFK